MTPEHLNHTDETDRLHLGELLKAARERAGVKQVEARALIGKSQSTMAKIEAGTTSISRHALQKLIAVYAPPADDVPTMWVLWEKANSPTRLRHGQRIGTPVWFREVLLTEQLTDEMRSWTGERVPGLLQCESYMLDQFDGEGRGPEISPRLIQRRKRQLMFEDGNRSFTFLMSESALDRLCAQTRHPDVVADQLKHMIGLAERDNITIRVVQYQAVAYVDPDFVILRNSEGDRAYSEYLTNVRWANMRELAIYHDAWSALLSIAASPEKTLEDLHRRCRLADLSDPDGG
ncbi:helix-turn-helix transcriptional regulator [Amycolatopsis sp. BJA-103]|uniref:helix-turn-helix domain-containing protein n=1 Tax=unclassified Amycolatopsis TaxID=2618356 RepID=UPI001304E0DA|nr:helix-turn-helix transcriptional regulator [Amycolatopsis sp. BJA-103]